MTKNKKLNYCKLYNEDCIQYLKKIKSNSIDLIFADPPYNLSDKKFLTVKSGKVAKCDKGEWDKINDIESFNIDWLTQCKRILKETGTIWISGTLHNHPSIGQCLKNLGFWIINDIIWFKRNAPPLLSRNRLVPSTEYRSVIAYNNRSRDGLFVVYAKSNDRQVSRLGVTVSRRVAARAVERNRIKRAIRESFRHQQIILLGLDIVVIARRATKGIETNKLFVSLEGHWRRVNQRCRPANL